MDPGDERTGSLGQITVGTVSLVTLGKIRADFGERKMKFHAQIVL